MLAASSLLITALIVYLIDLFTKQVGYVNLYHLIVYSILVVIIILRHMPNIQRLKNGTEPKASLKKNVN